MVCGCARRRPPEDMGKTRTSLRLELGNDAKKAPAQTDQFIKFVICPNFRGVSVSALEHPTHTSGWHIETRERRRALAHRDGSVSALAHSLRFRHHPEYGLLGTPHMNLHAYEPHISWVHPSEQRLDSQIQNSETEPQSQGRLEAARGPISTRSHWCTRVQNPATHFPQVCSRFRRRGRARRSSSSSPARATRSDRTTASTAPSPPSLVTRTSSLSTSSLFLFVLLFLSQQQKGRSGHTFLAVSAGRNTKHVLCPRLRQRFRPIERASNPIARARTRGSDVQNFLIWTIRGVLSVPRRISRRRARRR